MITGPGFAEGACTEEEAMAEQWEELKLNDRFPKLKILTGAALMAVELQEALLEPADPDKLPMENASIFTARAQEMALFKYVVETVGENRPADISTDDAYKEYLDVVGAACKEARNIAFMATHVASAYQPNLIKTVDELAVALVVEDCYKDPDEI